MQLPQWIIFIPLSIAATLAVAVVLIIVLSANGDRIRDAHPMTAGLIIGLALGAILGAMIGYESGNLALMMLAGGLAGLVIGAGIGGTYQMWLRW